nr:immunoglobulin heavy chain junction region [Macaca mulatta]MOY21090.1 immunoglobulin heavy chain junction region [Macaca mulatta]MOY21825.1 immunoglobulin heavy chain junction region [Macaca mulatta]MOY21834.1 immunoglobulin heavy chain junction region [Macaca mulatta]MOY22794.1 immunoglobulin heavy chain junction region [Macaca mulatta]
CARGPSIWLPNFDYW